MKVFCLITVTLIIGFTSNSLIAQQKYDNNWVIGGFPSSKTDPNPDYKIMGLNFDNYDLKINTLLSDSIGIFGVYFGNAASLSTSEGKLLMSTNGKRLLDEDFKIIPNGDSLNYGALWDWDPYTHNSPEGTRIIPMPGDEESTALVVHSRVEWSTKIKQYVGYALNTTKVKIENGKALEVLYKNVPIDTGNLDFFEMCKHANGRDWWVLFPQRFTNTMKRVLIGPNGPGEIMTQSLPNEYFDGSGQHRISPDGSYYVTTSTTYDNIKRYDFDRCTGEIHNQKIYQIDTLRGTWSAFSQNSRYLYVLNFKSILQFEMYSQEFKPDTVATVEPFEENGDQLYFGAMQLAADGKIYVASRGSVHYMSVINDPDKAGKACGVSQFSIKLPAYNYECVNKFPYYRLGPLEGSECDTLGLKNIPLAKFRYVKDTTTKGLVNFIDLSDYNPTDWLWDFGDGGTDTEQRPVHIYQKPGIYNVCLTAYNKNGSSTYCKTLECTSTATEAVARLLDIKVYPNPAAEFFILESKEPYYYEAQLRLLSINGEVLQTSKIDISSGFVTIEIGNMNKGMYFIEVKGREGILYRGKLVLVE